ncbi:MAG: DUF4340 domain-containing protein [Parvibaculum sp.]|nr:DUF4340 domain-containing protein [Parvibaculum sp.]
MTFSLGAMRSNKPLRNLVLLGVLTGLTVAASIAAVSVQERSVQAKFVPEPMYPGLETGLDKVSKIVYMLPRGMRDPEKITLTRNANNQWVVTERKDYPADQDLVRKALIGVSELQLYQPRTARKEWLRELGLLEPENLGKAVRVEFFDKDGVKVVSLLAGKVPEQTTDARGQGMIYVRRDGEDQSWLARGRLPLAQTAQDWLDQKFLDVKRDDIRKLTLWEGTDHPVVMSRLSADANDFSIENVPAGRVTRGAPIVNGSATAIVDMNFEDVVPIASFDFPESSPKAVFELFDGTKLTLIITGGGGALWTKIVAEGAPDTESGKRAGVLNARLAPWAYKLTKDAGGQLTQSMDLLTHEGGLPE